MIYPPWVRGASHLRFSLRQAQLRVTVSLMRHLLNCRRPQCGAWDGEHLSTCAPFAVFMGKEGNKPVGTHRSKPPSRRSAISLKLAIGALQRNIRKLERTGASPLLIATRKKRLAGIQKEWVFRLFSG